MSTDVEKIKRDIATLQTPAPQPAAPQPTPAPQPAAKPIPPEVGQQMAARYVPALKKAAATTVKTAQDLTDVGEIVHGTGTPTPRQRDIYRNMSDEQLAAAAGYDTTPIEAPERVTPAPLTGYGAMTAAANAADRQAYGDDAESVRRKARVNRARRIIAGVGDVLTHAANIWATTKGAPSMKIRNVSEAVDKDITTENAARAKRESARATAQQRADMRDAGEAERNVSEAERTNAINERDWRNRLNRQQSDIRAAARRVRSGFERRVNSAERAERQKKVKQCNDLLKIYNRPHEKMSPASLKTLQDLYRELYNSPLPQRPTKAPRQKAKSSKSDKSDKSRSDSVREDK